MYKKLQKQFLWGSALVMMLVILLVEGIVFAVSSSAVSNQTRVLTNMILDNGGEMPSAREFTASERTFLALSRESVHETRFFSVMEKDAETSIVVMRLMGVSEEEALGLAGSYLDEISDYGSAKLTDGRSLRYGKRVSDDGSRLIVFMDSESRLALVNLVMMFTGGLWLLMLLLYILIMGHYSGKLVQPFVENDERQKRFITNASHELKTPLAVISANTEMTEAIGGKNKWTESTRRQTARLQSLIEDLVVLTRLNEMKELELSDVDFSVIVAESAENYRGLAESSGKQFESSVDPDVHIRADRRSLQQLTEILMDNANKYCDDGGGIRVELKKRNGNRGGVLTVSNTYAEGKDMDFSRFFERFYRQDESHNSGKSGFGIGLSMGKEIAERMKGKLKVGYSGDMISFRAEF